MNNKVSLSISLVIDLRYGKKIDVETDMLSMLNQDEKIEYHRVMDYVNKHGDYPDDHKLYLQKSMSDYYDNYKFDDFD